MNKHISIGLGLFALTALAAARSGAVAPERLVFAVTPEAGLAKTLYVSHELGLTASNRSRNGGVPVTDGTQGWISTWLKVSCQDTYLDTSEGWPRHFKRRYTDLGGGGKLNMKIGARQMPHEEVLVAVSPLRERTVEFTWVPEEDDWSRAWTRFDSDEDWLADLNGDLDLLVLLPAGEVAVGDTWSPSIEVVRKLLAPGGNHLITPRTGNTFGRTVEVGVGGDAAEVLGSDLAGSVSARFEGVREEDGRRLGVVAVKIEGLRSVTDRTDLWRTSMSPEERNEPAKLLAALIEYSLDAQGELLWDLEGGHMHSFLLTGKEGYNLVVNKEITGDREIFELSQHSVFDGDLSLRVSLDEPSDEAGSAPANGGATGGGR